MNKKIITFLSALLFVLAFSSNVVLAAVKTVQTDDISRPTVKTVQNECKFTVPSEKIYKANVIAIRRKLKVEYEEELQVKAFIKNTGTMPWFESDSTCLGPKMSLATARDLDRESELYLEESFKTKDTNWESASRVGMDQDRINPGEIGSFTFYIKAPKRDDLVKEYFVPMIEGIQTIDDSEFAIEMIVGNPNVTPINMRRKLLYKNESGSAYDINLNGEKTLLVDLSEQKMFVKLDNHVVATFPTSTGAPSTPTPTGLHEISLKQEVRVGSSAPHYIMPKFMWFRAGGYGVHALPMLNTDGGRFWAEARDHIGLRVSHGCIRLLPEDADYVFDFADIGTKIDIQN